MWTRGLLCAAVFITATHIGWAEESVSTSDARTVGSHEPLRYGTTRSTTVIRADEIERSQSQTVLDVLRTVPGVFVRQSGALGRTTSVIVRGSTESQVLVLLDGVDVGSPTLGNYDFSTLPARFVERIEIIRGSATTAYGAKAIGGVINIVTKRGDGPLHLQTRGEFGSRRTFQESVAVGGQREGLRGYLGVDRLDSHGIGSPEGVAVTHVATAGSATLAKWLALDAAVNSDRSRVGIGDGAFTLDPNRFVERQQVTASTTMHLMPDGPSDHALQFSYNLDNLLDFDEPNPGTLDEQAKSIINTQRYGLELRNHFEAGPLGRLTTGAEAHDDEARTTNFTKSHVTWSWYLQHELTPTDRLTLVGGVRDTRLHFFGQAVTADASAAYRLPVIETELRASFSQGIRPPTMNELFFPDYGNPDLSPEKSRMFEIGAGRDWWGNRVGGDIAWFHTRVKDLIQTTTTSGGGFRAANISRAVMTGVEMTGHVEPLTGLRFGAAWTLLDATDLSNHDELARVPQQTVALTTDYAGASWWRVHLRTTLVGHQEEPVDVNNRQRVKAYARLDGGVSVQVARHVRLRGRVENLLNRRYSEVLGFPSSGTAVYVGAVVDL